MSELPSNILTKEYLRRVQSEIDRAMGERAPRLVVLAASSRDIFREFNERVRSLYSLRGTNLSRLAFADSLSAMVATIVRDELLQQMAVSIATPISRREEFKRVHYIHSTGNPSIYYHVISSRGPTNKNDWINFLTINSNMRQIMDVFETNR